MPLASAWLLFLCLSHSSERLSPLGLWTSLIEGMLPAGSSLFQAIPEIVLRSAGFRVLTNAVGIIAVMLRKTLALQRRLDGPCHTERIRCPLASRVDN